MTLPSTEPLLIFDHLEKLLGLCGVLEFATYKYQVVGTADDRVIHQVQVHDAINWFIKTRSELPADYDICLQSRCLSEDGQVWLIPMIDFQHSPTTFEWKGIFQSLKESFFIKDFFCFHSGRSSHLYALPLLKNEQSVKFYGTLLLFNSKNDELVDARWVGHALTSGYSALRWTSNNKWYLQMPKLEIEYHYP